MIEKINWNYGPVGIIEKVDSNKFWNYISIYSADSVEYCQIIGERLKQYKGREVNYYSKKEKTNVLSGIVFVFDDFSFIVENNQWEKSQRFWKVAVCHHDYKEVGLKRARELGVTHFGNCYHVYECKLCHKAYGQDSSG